MMSLVSQLRVSFNSQFKFIQLIFLKPMPSQKKKRSQMPKFAEKAYQFKIPKEFISTMEVNTA
jgi:hypothetical protein